MNIWAHIDQLAGKKIVILIGYFGRGGCERQAFLLARAMRHDYGLNAQVWALTHWTEYAEEFEDAGIPTRSLEFRFPACPVVPVRLLSWVGRIHKLSKEFANAGVNVLMPFTTYPNVVAGLAYRLGGVQLCIWGERHSGGERAPGIERIAVRQYHHFAANSTAGVEFLKGEMGVRADRISYIPNGVEEPLVNSSVDWRGRLGLTARQLLVVKVANLTRFKDHATLLRAWKSVQDEWRGSDKPVLALAGYQAETYDECLRIVRESGLGASVRFLGGVSDVPALLHACDITAFSSRAEGMPNAVLECMAAGKAVVAADLPGIRDALGPDAEDVMVPPGDANAFAQKLLQLLRNDNEREAWGRANRARIAAEFSVEGMVERHLNVIVQNLPRESQRSLPVEPNKRSAEVN